MTARRFIDIPTLFKSKQYSDVTFDVKDKNGFDLSIPAQTKLFFDICSHIRYKQPLSLGTFSTVPRWQKS